MSSSDILILWAILTFIFVLKLVYDSKAAGLSAIPGPFLARYTDAWALHRAWRSFGSFNVAKDLKALQAIYGDVIRTGPRTVIVLDPAAVPVIYGVRSKLNKGNAYLPFRQSGVTTSLLSIQEEDKHAKYRKVVSNAYSMSSLKGYEPNVDEMVKRFVEVCDQHAQTKEPMNISMWCTYYCFDVVSKVTMGSPLGFLEGKGRDAYGLYEKVRRFGVYVSIISQMPWLHRIFQENILMRRTKPSPFLKVVQGRVTERLLKPDTGTQLRPDLLSHFVAAHETSPDVMTPKQVAISTSGNLIAGGLSPGKTFDELCRFLATHPESQDKLYQELTQAKCTYPAGFDHVQNVPYLEGIVREALRLHSSASFNLQRVTGPSGLTLPNGVIIPGNINIGCSGSFIGRNAEVFGSDADVYKPERWMQGPKEEDEAYERRRKAMDRADLSFGQGSRTCIGKNIFNLEVYKATATLVGLFKFEKVERSESDGVFVKVHRRESILEGHRSIS